MTVEMGVLRLFPTLVYQIDASELIEAAEKLERMLPGLKKQMMPVKINGY